jgi:TonB family protein
MKLPKKDRSKISYAFIFSLILHSCLVAYFLKNNSKTDAAAKQAMLLKNSQKVSNIKLDSIKFISPKELKAIKEVQNRQIVANEQRGKTERPVNSRFLGEKDQTFERQTVAANNGAFKEAGLGKKDGSKASLEQMEPVEKKVSSNKPKTPKKALTMSDLGGFKMADIEKDQKVAEESLDDMTKKMAEEKKSGAEGVEKGKAGINGLAQNNDFIEEVPLGDMTNLNTTEFKYYGFYHRIRQKLEQHWGSSIKDKAKNLYRSGRRMPASENLITSVTVTLDDHGQIVDMQIEGTSGVRELDQAAIESFNKAGPFPNPPKGLLVGGRATIQWGFVVKS